MIDQYFGIKELYEVALRAKTPMQFGDRYIEEGEVVLYFENINMSLLTERSSPIIARGGWSNMPRVIWEDRSEVEFSLSEGVMSSISMGILLSANVTKKKQDESLLVQKREGPFELEQYGDNVRLRLKYWPVPLEKKKTFIYEFARDVAQRKVYGRRLEGIIDPFDDSKTIPYIEVFEDKALTIPADKSKKYIVDYYYEYDGNEALIYTIQKERFNGLFSLEGKFYSKDENEGKNYTNLLYMPKVRVVSDISLRLGERADPTMSVFNIIGLPVNAGVDRKGMILEITRLDRNIDEEI